MKKKKPLFFGLRVKVIFLTLFILGIVLCVGIVGIIANQKLVNISTSVTETEVAQMAVVQEITESLRLANVYSSVLFMVHDHVPIETTNEYLDLFKESFDQARIFIEALAWGSESDTFKQIDDGELYKQWKSLNKNHALFIPEPSHELQQLALDLNQYVSRYRTAVEEFNVQYSDVPATTSEGVVDDYATERRNAYRVYDELTIHFLPISETLEKIKATSRIGVRLANGTIHDVAERVKFITVGVFVVGTVLILVVSLLFVHLSIVKPLNTLIDTAKEIASGKLTTRVRVLSKDEIGTLARVFNEMAVHLMDSYDNLEKLVKDKTVTLSEVLRNIELKNKELEKSQLVATNLLEDLEIEKQKVELKVAERTKELEREKNKLLQVTSNMRGGGILLDNNQKVVFFNGETEKILGVPGANNNTILGEFFTYFDGTPIKEYFARCMQGETFCVPEIEGKGQRVYEIFFRYLDLETEHSGGGGYFILFFDITELKLLERSKSELVAVASHQLRTPLTAMRGNVEMLTDGSFGEVNHEQREMLSDIELSIVRLISMVNDMLDITKIENRSLELNVGKLNVQEKMNAIIASLATYADRHNFTITTAGIPNDVCILGDEERIRQVFQNIIDNAIKYSSHPGELQISARRDDSFVEIEFRDNGIGIPKNEQSKMFNRFYRASNTVSSSSSGSGLGLYIVKSIIEQHGGDIRFESKEGEGTTFFVRLPVYNS